MAATRHDMHACFSVLPPVRAVSVQHAWHSRSHPAHSPLLLTPGNASHEPLWPTHPGPSSGRSAARRVPGRTHSSAQARERAPQCKMACQSPRQCFPEAAIEVDSHNSGTRRPRRLRVVHWCSANAWTPARVSGRRGTSARAAYMTAPISVHAFGRRYRRFSAMPPTRPRRGGRHAACACRSRPLPPCAVKSAPLCMRVAADLRSGTHSCGCRICDACCVGSLHQRRRDHATKHNSVSTLKTYAHTSKSYPICVRSPHCRPLAAIARGTDRHAVPPSARPSWPNMPPAAAASPPQPQAEETQRAAACGALRAAFAHPRGPACRAPPPGAAGTTSAAQTRDGINCR